MPPKVGRLVARLVLSERQTRLPLRGAAIGIEADMAHPGMTPIFAQARELAPGGYEATLQLTMPGDWVLLVEAKLPDGRVVRRELPLHGVRPAA